MSYKWFVFTGSHYHSVGDLLCYVCEFIQTWSTAAADAAEAYLNNDCSHHFEHQSPSAYGQNMYVSWLPDIGDALTVSTMIMLIDYNTHFHFGRTHARSTCVSTYVGLCTYVYHCTGGFTYSNSIITKK